MHEESYEFIKGERGNGKNPQPIYRYRFKYPASRSKYTPHQGAKECERRRLQNGG